MWRISSPWEKNEKDLGLSEKWKRKCRLATDEELKGKHLGPYYHIKEYLKQCKLNKGIPWLKDESCFIK